MEFTNFRNNYIKTFGILMSINFPLFFFFQLSTGQYNSYELTLRTICTCLAAFLIFYKNWPLYLKKYLAHIWLFTITVCLPFFFISLLLINKFSIFSVISLFAAVSFLLLITSLQEFIFSALSGTITALLTYRFLMGNIDIQLASENLWCYCDKHKIKQVLKHLILNAIKFSHNKPITIKIEKHKYYLKILVIDQGIGVDSNDRQIIFEDFEEGSLTKKAAGGKGIGLAICKHIISAHSGYISVNNNKDSGCTFTVSLPTKN